MAGDPLADYLFGQINLPQQFTGAMENLGFQGTPFGGVQQGYDDVENFQRSLKKILDSQLGAFGSGVGTNLNYLPANLRGMFNAAAPVMTDPAWGIIGAPGMFSGGYKFGDLPSGRTMAHQQYWDRINAPPAVALGGGNNLGGGGGGGSNIGGTQPFSIGLHGGGTMTVNAHDIASAIANAQAQGGVIEPGQAQAGGHASFPNIAPPIPTPSTHAITGGNAAKLKQY